jgi:hypothetical protein
MEDMQSHWDEQHALRRGLHQGPENSKLHMSRGKGASKGIKVRPEEQEVRIVESQEGFKRVKIQ